MINCVVDRKIWWSRFNRYTTGMIRLLDVEKDGVQRLVFQPLGWITTYAKTVYLSYKGKRYKIITLVDDDLTPDLLYEVVPIEGTDCYKLEYAHYFNLSDYLEEE